MAPRISARGDVQGERSLAEEYFSRVYEEASRLDMPMTIHTGPAAPRTLEVLDNRINGPFTGVRMLPLVVQNLVFMANSQKFPDLRIGFIETGRRGCPICADFVEA